MNTLKPLIFLFNPIWISFPIIFLYSNHIWIVNAQNVAFINTYYVRLHCIHTGLCIANDTNKRPVH